MNQIGSLFQFSGKKSCIIWTPQLFFINLGIVIEIFIGTVMLKYKELHVAMRQQYEKIMYILNNVELSLNFLSM